MIVRARVVVTMDGPPIENGAVVISGARIIDVARFSELSKTHSRKDLVDLGDQALLPGLTNAHCHLDYTCLRGKITRHKSFTAWIQAINFEKAKLSPEDYVASINAGFLEAKRFGTTTIANLTAFPELVSQIESPIRTWWFAELIDVRDPSRANEIVDLAVEQLKSQERWGLAPHAPYTASAELYRRCEEIAPVLTTHLAESREEMEMFRDGRGPLFEFLKGLGRDTGDCGQATPVGHFFGRGDCPQSVRAGLTFAGGSVNRPYLFVHLNELSESDFDLLKQAAKNSSIVHCPRSHGYFGQSAFQFEKLQQAGCNICLGTDSLASNDDLSPFAEMRAFQKEFPGVSAEEILKMATLNPARALRQKDVLGKIQRGAIADFIALPIEKMNSIFEVIVAFDQPVSWSMVGGRILP